MFFVFVFFKQKTAYEMRISDWSSDVCSSDLGVWADDSFHAFWAHDHAAEAQALERLLAFFRNRLTAYPQARIYHYAPYEITALRRLTTRYGIGEGIG